MELNTLDVGTEKVAEVVADSMVIGSVRDALDLLATAQHQEDATCVMILEKNLPAEFFDLKTGLAGEILQKYTTYRMKLVIIGDFAVVQSKSLQAFIRESNRGKQVAFVTTREEALRHITGW